MFSNPNNYFMERPIRFVDCAVGTENQMYIVKLTKINNHPVLSISVIGVEAYGGFRVDIWTAEDNDSPVRTILTNQIDIKYGKQPKEEK